MELSDAQKKEMKESELWLKQEAEEAYILELVNQIKLCLRLARADTKQCLQLMDEMLKVNIDPLMVKKHPDIVDTVKKLQRYIGNTSEWGMTEEETKKFHAATEQIRAKATLVYHKFEPLPPIRNVSKKRDISEDSKLGLSQNSNKKRMSSSDFATRSRSYVEKGCKEGDTASRNQEEAENLKENLLRDEANCEKERGNQFVKEGKFDEAIQCYSKAIKCYSKDPIYFANRALCYLKKKDYRAAETDCTSALTLDTAYVKALQRRATARRELGLLEEGLADMRQALEIEPSNRALIADRNFLDHKIKNKNRPLPPIRNVSKKRDFSEDSKVGSSQNSNKKRMSSSDFATRVSLDVEKGCKDGDISSRNQEEAENLNENLLRDEANCEKERGNQFVKEGKFDEAIQCYSKAIKCYSKDPIYFANRALCYLKKKDYWAAETDCTSALTLDTAYVKALQRRATARRELGRLKEGLADIRRALEIEPGNRALIEDRSFLEQKIENSDRAVHNVVVSLVIPLPVDLDNTSEEPILPAKKHTTKGKESIVETDDSLLPSTSSPSSKSQFIMKTSGEISGSFKRTDATLTSAPASTKSNFTVETPSEASSSKLSKDIPSPWPTHENVSVIEPVNIPTHQRSKKRLKVIEILKTHDEVLGEEVPLRSQQSAKTSSSTEVGCALTTNAAISNIMSQSTTVTSTELSDQIKPVFPIDVPPAPKNSVQFLAGWRQLQDDLDLTYRFLKQISGMALPQVLQDSLDGNILSRIIEVLASKFIAEGDSVVDYLKGLSKVHRFRALSMFLNKEDKKNLVQLFQHCHDDIESLKKEYEL